MKKRLLPALLMGLCALVLAPAVAGAYNYSYIPDDQHAHVYGLSPDLTTLVEVVRGGVAIDSDSFSDGNDSLHLELSPQPGDTLKIYQPYTADPSTATPVASWVLQNLTITAASGSPVISGQAPDGWTVVSSTHKACYGVPQVFSTTAAGGSYSFNAALPLGPRDWAAVVARSADGNILGSYEDSFDVSYSETTVGVPGDALCIRVGSADYPSPSSHPYYISAGELDWDAFGTARTVLRRGGAIVADVNSSDLSLTAAQRPLPGDTVEVYRPEGAATPSLTWTIPAASGRYDSSNDLVAIDAPALLELYVFACNPLACDDVNAERFGVDLPAGRTFLSFAQSQAWSRPISLVGAHVSATVYVPGGSYEFSLTPGDLTNPVGKLSLGKSLKAKGLGKKSLKVKFTSSEAGSSVAKLTIPGKSKKSKPVTLASSKSAAVKAGSNSLTLKFSKSGKKAAAKLAPKKPKKSKKSKKKAKKTTATLTMTLTDSSGNATTIVKTTTIK